MKMSDKLKLIDFLVKGYAPVEVYGQLFREDIKRVLQGKLPVERVEGVHKCVYMSGVCDCGNREEDHYKNYGLPETDCYGLRVGSKAYNDLYEINS